MAIKLRQDKGSPLTQQEVDENFASNIYSASLETGSIALYYTASVHSGPAQKTLQIPLQWTTTDGGLNIARSGTPGSIVKISGSIQTGRDTTTTGLYSYAGGIGTTTNASYQQVQGAYNISSSSPSAFIIGNGTSNATRSNLVFASGSQVVISGSLNVSGSISGDGSQLANVNSLTKVFYVTENGNDNFDGKTLQTSFRTIKRACQAASASYALNPTDPTGPTPYRVNINVKSGYYSEEAPVTVPAFTTINGNDLRSVIVAPSGSTSGSNLFQLNNATYIYGLRLEGCVLDSLENPRQGFFFAYEPGAYLTTSPYIQNCTAVNTPFDKFYTPLDFETGNPQVGNGPGGMIVDDSVLDPYSPLKSMIVDAYTQVAFNGIGICLRGRGYGQMVSFFTNFSRVGVFAIDGGHASLLNSNTTFGDYGLRTSGSRILVNPDISTVDPALYTSSADLLSTMKAGIQEYEIAFLKASGSSAYTGSAYAGTTGSNPLLANCKKDAGFLVDALVADLKSKDAANTSKFIQGYFKAQDVSTNQRYTLPSASNAYTKGVITVIPQRSGSDPNAPLDDKKFTKDYLLTFNAIADYIYTSSLSAPAKGKVRQLINTLNHTISSVVLQETDNYKKVVPTPVNRATVFTAPDIQTLINSRSAILDYEIDQLQNTTTNFTNSRYDDPIVIAKCRRDAGHLLDAIEADLLTTGSAYTTRFIQSYFPPISGSTATRILNSGLGTAIPSSSNENIARDYNLAFGFIATGSGFYASSIITGSINALISSVQNTITALVINNPATSTLIEPVVLLDEFGSLITSTSHDFSYAGSGVNYLAFPNNQGGTGKTSVERRIFNEGLGRVYHTSGDETGDFYAGDDFVIRQDTGTIDGRSFSKSVSALTIPINLALEG